MYDPSTVVGKNLKNYWGRNAFNCKFIISDTVGASTNAWAKIDRNTKKDVYIILNKNYVERASMLELAETMIHETIHGYLFSQIVLANTSAGSLGLSNVSSDANFKDVWSAYALLPGSQHEFMAANYIATIRDGLKDFLSRNPCELTFTDAELEHMAWGGLSETLDFDVKSRVDSQFQKYISDVWVKARRITKECH